MKVIREVILYALVITCLLATAMIIGNSIPITLNSA
jgi:hypothetical protein